MPGGFFEIGCGYLVHFIGYFLRLVLITNVIALPVAYYLICEWLNNFAYKTDLTARPFLLAGVAGILLVVIAGAYSAMRSDRINPVEIIKLY